MLRHHRQGGGPAALQQLGPLLDHMLTLMTREKEALELLSKQVVVTVEEGGNDDDEKESADGDDTRMAAASFKASASA